MAPERRRNLLIWIGFAVVLAGSLSYIPLFALFPITRDIPWVNLLLFAVGLILLGVGLNRAYRIPLVYRGRISGSVLGALGLLMIGLFCYGVFFLTKVPAAQSAPKPGDPAPTFVLSRSDGVQVSLQNLVNGRRAALLIFYRGYW